MIKKISLTPAIFHLSDRVNEVHAEYSKNPIMPRSPEFKPLIERLRRKLTDAFDATDTHEAVLFVSSGSGGISAAIGSCTDKQGKILVISNGAYGERMADFGRVFHREIYHYQLPYGEKPCSKQIENLILTHKPDVLGIVHGATTTCSLNPLEEISKLSKQYGLKLVVDCISSAFVDEVRVKDWGVDILIGSSNKGLHSTPGFSFVLVEKDYLQSMKGYKVRTPYFGVYANYEKQKNHQFAFTVDARILLEMEAALDEFFETGGLKNRMEVYQQRNSYLRKEFERLGLKLFQKEGMPLQNVGTALMIPEYTDYESMAKCLEENTRFDEAYMIYSAQNNLSGSVFRVFNMGEYDMQSYENFITVFEDVLKQLQK